LRKRVKLSNTKKGFREGMKVLFRGAPVDSQKSPKEQQLFNQFFNLYADEKIGFKSDALTEKIVSSVSTFKGYLTCLERG